MHLRLPRAVQYKTGCHFDRNEVKREITKPKVRQFWTPPVEDFSLRIATVEMTTQVNNLQSDCPTDKHRLVFRGFFGTIARMGGVFAGLFYVALLTVGGESVPTLLTANEHPWGRFQPKSWCIVQTTIVSSLERQAVRSVQTVKTTLKSIEETSLTLEELETLELGGQIITKKPQIVKVDFFQEPVQDSVQIRQGPSAKIVIDKKVVPCGVRIYEQQTARGHLTTTIWYTPHVYPYVLRVEKILRSSSAHEDAGERVLQQSVMLIQETAALKSARSNRRTRTYSLRMEEKGGNLTKITEARCSWDVPGGLLESTTREFDVQNREIRRSVSRMFNYSASEAVSVGRTSRYYRTWVPVEVMD